jgi:hypothetical protein
MGSIFRFLTLANWTDKLSRNVSQKLPLLVSKSQKRAVLIYFLAEACNKAQLDVFRWTWMGLLVAVECWVLSVFSDRNMERKCVMLWLHCSTKLVLRLVCVNEKVLLVQELTVWCRCHRNGLCGCETGEEIFINVISCLFFKFGKGRIFQNLSQCENKRNICMSVAIICSYFNAAYVGTIRCS